MASNLRVRRGTILGSCHMVEDIIGRGGFGVVAKCLNTETNETVAVKVSKGQDGFVQQAIGEIAILKRLRCLDLDICNIVQCYGFFFDQENICVSFELLDQSLYRYMEQQQNTWGLSTGELRPILHQLATALSHLHSIGITHMDLKPDNVMIVDRHQYPMKIKLIDFGMARPVSALKQGDCMGTLPYCAPEMFLGVPMSESIDVWALGVLMAELTMGCSLYPGETEYDVLRFIVETQGQPPDDVLDHGCYTDQYFYSQENSGSRWRFKTPDDVHKEHGFRATETRSVRLSSLDEIEQNIKQDNDHRDQKMLISLIKSMLILDGCNRIKAQEVLEHPFFTPSLPQSSSKHGGIEGTHRNNQGRPEMPYHAAAMSLQEHVPFHNQHSLPLRAAVSLGEHVNFRTLLSQTATLGEEPKDSNFQFLTLPVAAISQEECAETPMPTADDNIKISDTKDEVLRQTPSQAVTVGECCPEADSQTEDIKRSSMEDEVLHPAPSSSDTSLEHSLEANTRTEAKQKKNTLWRRIKRRVRGFFRKHFSQ